MDSGRNCILYAEVEMMKACLYCKYGREDDQGVQCTVDWDLLEYENYAKQKEVQDACEEAKRIRDERKNLDAYRPYDNLESRETREKKKGQKVCGRCQGKFDRLHSADRCRKCYDREYYEKNKARIDARVKAYDAKHRKQRLKYLREYSRRKKERQKEKAIA